MWARPGSQVLAHRSGRSPEGSWWGLGWTPVDFEQSQSLTRPFLADLLLLPSQVPTVLLATHLSLLQEVRLH
jgi:hypothetical protein